MLRSGATRAGAGASGRLREASRAAAAGRGRAPGASALGPREGGSAAAWEMKGPVTIGSANPQQPEGTPRTPSPPSPNCWTTTRQGTDSSLNYVVRHELFRAVRQTPQIRPEAID